MQNPLRVFRFVLLSAFVTAVAALWTFPVQAKKCRPVTCAELGKDCGTTDDGCGGSLDCGPCPTDGFQYAPSPHSNEVPVDAFAFVSDRGGVYNLYRTNVASAVSPSPLTNFPAPQPAGSGGLNIKTCPRLPSFSPNGARLAYTMVGNYEGRFHFDLSLLDLAAASQAPLTQYSPWLDDAGQPIIGAAPSWNPVDGSAVFVSFRPLAPAAFDQTSVPLTSKQAYVSRVPFLRNRKLARLEAVRPPALVRPKETVAISRPAFPSGWASVLDPDPPRPSPLSAGGCGLQIKRIHPDGRVTEELSNPVFSNPSGTKWEYGQPAVLPGGDRVIVPIKKGSGKYDLYLKDLGDTDLNRLVNLTATADRDEKSPSVSADGRGIVYTVSAGGSEQIQRADLDPESPGIRNPVLLTTPTNDIDPDDNTNPCFTVSGKILFVANRDGNREIYQMDANGSNPVNLTRNPADDIDVACAPFSDRVIQLQALP